MSLKNRQILHVLLRSPLIPFYALGASMNVGGQAVLEGVMMRSPNALSVVVRRSDGTIAFKEDKWVSFSQRFPWLKFPFLRGVVVLIESLVNGLQALHFSAQVAAEDNDSITQDGQTLSSWAIAFTICLSIALGLLFFVALPHLASMGLLSAMDLNDGMDSMWFHVVDGMIKILFFISYILAIGFMPEIRRVFEYHGAEHKAIHVYEAGRPLFVENARYYDTIHSRCGTSFLMVVLLVSIALFTVVLPLLPHTNSKWIDIPLSIGFKVLLMFPIAGISYELIKISDRLKKGDDFTLLKWIMKIFLFPGLLMQRLTTREPSDDQVQVAMESLERVLRLELVLQNSH